MNVYFYSVILLLHLVLLTSSVSPRKLQKKTKFNNNKIFEKRHLITARQPTMDVFRNNAPGVVQKRIKLHVDPIEESCQSVTFKSEFNNLRQRVKCDPRDTVVDIMPPPGATIIPNAVIVKRCGGMCNGYKRCLPVEIQERKFYVKTVKNNEIHCSSITVAEDVKCRCNCKQTHKDCSIHEVYSKEICACMCKNQKEYVQCMDSQNENVFWDESTCSCICQQNKVCTTGSHWKESECRCVKSGS